VKPIYFLLRMKLSYLPLSLFLFFFYMGRRGDASYLCSCLFLTLHPILSSRPEPLGPCSLPPSNDTISRVLTPPSRPDTNLFFNTFSFSPPFPPRLCFRLRKPATGCSMSYISSAIVQSLRAPPPSPSLILFGLRLTFTPHPGSCAPSDLFVFFCSHISLPKYLLFRQLFRPP